jgi:tetratricopeptide (TPR) repeat protein
VATRLGRFAQGFIEAGWLAAALLVPLFFNVYSARIFEPDKLTVLRTVVLFMALAGVVWALETRSTGRPSLPLSTARDNPLVASAFLFGAVYVLTTLTSLNPEVSFWGSYQRLQGTLVNLCYVALFFFIAGFTRHRPQVDRLVTVMISTSVPVSLYGLIQYLGGLPGAPIRDPLPWGSDVTQRVTSTMGNPIFLGAWLIMVVPLTAARLIPAAAAFLRAANWPGPFPWAAWARTAGYGLVLTLQLLVTLFTQSRGPWLGLLAGLFLFGVLTPLRLGRRRLALAGGAAGLAVAGFIGLLNLPGSPLEPIKEHNRYLERLGSIAEADSGTVKVRLLIWFGDGVGRGAVGLITDNPWRLIVGHGPETMYFAYGPYYPPDLAHYEARNASPDRSHNDLLDYLVTMGVLGLGVYLLVVGAFYWQAARLLVRLKALPDQLLVIALMSGVAAHLVETLTGIAIAATRTYFWLFLGLVAALTLAPPETGAAPAQAVGTVRRDRRPGGRAPRQPVQPRSGLRWGYIFGLYLVASAVLGLQALLGSVTPDSFIRRLDPVSLTLLGLGWLVLGLVLAAPVLAPRGVGRERATRPELIPLYGLLATGLFVFLVTSVLGVVIADMYFKQGQVLDDAQRYDLSIPAYLEALRWQPRQDFYYIFLARAYMELGRRAPEIPSTLASEGPRRVADLPAAATGLSRDQLFRAALFALEEAYRINPRNTDNSANLGRLYRVWAELTPDPAARQARFDQSEGYYWQATTRSPNTAHLYVEWATVRQLRGNPDGAEELARKALALDLKYAPTYVLLGDISLARSDLDQAESMYLQAVAVDGSLVGAYNALGYVYSRQGKRQEAVAVFRRAAELAPRDPTIRRNLALAYHDAGLDQQAIQELQVAINLAPADQQAPLRQLLQEWMRS